MQFGSPLFNGRIVAFLHHLEDGNTEKSQLFAVVRVFVSSLAARDTSFPGIFSLPADFLPSTDFNSFATSVLSVSWNVKMPPLALDFELLLGH